MEDSTRKEIKEKVCSVMDLFNEKNRKELNIPDKIEGLIVYFQQFESDLKKYPWFVRKLNTAKRTSLKNRWSSSIDCLICVYNRLRS